MPKEGPSKLDGSQKKKHHPSNHPVIRSAISWGKSGGIGFGGPREDSQDQTRPAAFFSVSRSQETLKIMPNPLTPAVTSGANKERIVMYIIPGGAARSWNPLAATLGPRGQGNWKIPMIPWWLTWMVYLFSHIYPEIPKSRINIMLTVFCQPWRLPVNSTISYTHFQLTKIQGTVMELQLVGGFNPSEKYESKWVHLPLVGVKIKNI